MSDTPARSSGLNRGLVHAIFYVLTACAGLVAGYLFWQMQGGGQPGGEPGGGAEGGEAGTCALQVHSDDGTVATLEGVTAVALDASASYDAAAGEQTVRIACTQDEAGEVDEGGELDEAGELDEGGEVDEGGEAGEGGEGDEGGELPPVPADYNDNKFRIEIRDLDEETRAKNDIRDVVKTGLYHVEQCIEQHRGDRPRVKLHYHYAVNPGGKITNALLLDNIPQDELTACAGPILASWNYGPAETSSFFKLKLVWVAPD